jgi:hypothetical protein
MAVGTIPVAWCLGDALARQPGMALVPSRFAGRVLIEGDLWCYGVGPGDVLVDETYSVRIEVPLTFPRALPLVFETGGRVPKNFHRNPNWTLCLGSPLAQTLGIEDAPTLGNFIDRVIVPYFYGHAVYERVGRMPFGELAHGVAGLENDVRRIFRLPFATDAAEFLRLASLKRRHANKQPCPCRSWRRVGRCHGPAVHHARRRLGRLGCAQQRMWLMEQRRAEPSSSSRAIARPRARVRGARGTRVR